MRIGADAGVLLISVIRHWTDLYLEYIQTRHPLAAPPPPPPPANAGPKVLQLGASGRSQRRAATGYVSA